VEGPDQATRFESETRGWQAAMQAGWANVAPPDHAPHDRPFGPDRTITCDGSGAGDCTEVRAYKNAIVCTGCRASGWKPGTEDRPGRRA